MSFSLLGPPPPARYVAATSGVSALGSWDWDDPGAPRGSSRKPGQLTDAEIVARLSPEARARREFETRRRETLERPLAERVPVARHEAGHAVIALALGVWVRRVSIVCEGARAGVCHVVHHRALEGPDAAQGQSLVDEIDRRVAVLLGGELSSRTTPWARAGELVDAAWWEAAEARELLALVHPGWKVEGKFLELARQTDALLAQPLHRDRCTLLAAALVRRAELDHDDVVAAIAPAGEWDGDALARVVAAERLVGVSPRATTGAFS